MKELLNIYNDNLDEIGVMPRDEIHRKGLKHKVVHCWIIQKDDDGGFIYFQQRSYNKSDFPGMYDIACAGHIDVGEEAKNAMKRELEEEIGLRVKNNDLKYIGRNFETLHKNEFLNDEICEMYMLEVDKNTVFMLGEEVEDIVKVPFKEYEKWINGEINALTVTSIKDSREAELNDENICPHIKEYNEQLIRAI